MFDGLILSKWEDKKMQYKAWSEAWDHCDKARDAAKPASGTNEKDDPSQTKKWRRREDHKD